MKSHMHPANRLVIGLAHINCTVGDMAGNLARGGHVPATEVAELSGDILRGDRETLMLKAHIGRSRRSGWVSYLETCAWNLVSHCVSTYSYRDGPTAHLTPQTQSFEPTEPSGHRRCKRGVKLSSGREPDVPRDLLRAQFGNVTKPHRLAIFFDCHRPRINRTRKPPRNRFANMDSSNGSELTNPDALSAARMIRATWSSITSRDASLVTNWLSSVATVIAN
jgi:hypothetical protein